MVMERDSGVGDCIVGTRGSKHMEQSGGGEEGREGGAADVEASADANVDAGAGIGVWITRDERRRGGGG